MADRDKNDHNQGRLPLPAREPPPAQSLAANVSRLPSADRWENCAFLRPFSCGEGADGGERAGGVFHRQGRYRRAAGGIANLYAGPGVNLARVAGKWAFRTAPDLSFILEPILSSRGGGQGGRWRPWRSSPTISPSRRAEIEEIRGVTTPRARWTCCLKWAGFACGPAPRAGRPVDLRQHRNLTGAFRFATSRTCRTWRAEGRGAARQQSASGLFDPSPTIPLS